MAEQSYTDLFNNTRILPPTSTFNSNAQPLGAAYDLDAASIFKALKMRTTPFSFNIDAVTASGSESRIFQAPFPMKIRAFQSSILALNSAATLTLDVLVKKGSASYTTVLDAAEDISAAIATPAEFAPENTTAINALCILDKGDLVKFTAAAGSGGNPDNIDVLMYWEHPDTSE